MASVAAVTDITAGEVGVAVAGGRSGAPGGAAPAAGSDHDTAGSTDASSDRGTAGPPAAARHVHRLRDLDRSGRRWAAAVAAALLLAPVAALVAFVPDWAPTNDPALMGLRALDVGTARTPLLGQPSQSGLYAEGTVNLHHPGPLHLYLMAVPVRLLGAAAAMPLVSVLVTGGCLAVAAWAVFRQLGRSAGVVAALALAVVAFTTGASSLVNPVSSSIAGHPLLATAVLAWCVGAGDVRLLPLAAAVASFTAQQHLSVVPATVVLVAGGLALLVVGWARAGHWADRANRRWLARRASTAAAVGLVLWSPVLAQQVAADRGNLGRIVWFARHSDHATLGYASAVRQVARAVGLPPLLGRTDVTGSWLLAPPTVLTWVSAGAVLAAVAALCLRWRATDPRRATLGPMVGVVAAAGVVNGAAVPRGLEQARLSFYHWAFALAFLVVIVLGLGVVDAVRRAVPAPGRALRATVAGLAVVAVAAPTAVDSAVDRRTDTALAAYASVDHDTLAALADGVEARADLVGAHTLLIARHEPLYAGIAAGLSLELTQRGIRVQHPLTDRHFVHDRHLVDRDRLDGGLVLVVDRAVPGRTPPGGELVAEVALADGVAVDDHRALVAAARAVDRVRLGPEATAALDAMAPAARSYMAAVVEGLVDDPERALLQPALLAFLHDHPVAAPALDPTRIERLLAGVTRIEAAGTMDGMTGLRVFHLDRAETLEHAVGSEVGYPDR